MSQTVEIVLLKIREKIVTWHESVIDNEHMNKRKSNKCCIFIKNRKSIVPVRKGSSDSDSE